MRAVFLRRTGLIVVLALALTGCARLRGIARGGQKAEDPGDIPTYGRQPSESAYRAVLMSNGMVLFGRLHGLGTPFPTLTDVYYVQTVTDPTTKKPAQVLIKRGQEWHAPDRTVLNATQIVLIEPVASGSKVMQLISKETASH